MGETKESENETVISPPLILTNDHNIPVMGSNDILISEPMNILNKGGRKPYKPSSDQSGALTLPARKRSNSQFEDDDTKKEHIRSASFNEYGLAKQIRKTSKGWKKEISKLVKEKGAEAGLKTFVSKLSISKPYNFSHTVNVKFNPNNLNFEGLPEQWENSFSCHFGSGIISCPRIQIEKYPERIPAILIFLKNVLYKTNAFKLEGIFRIAPDSEDCKQVKEQLRSSKFEFNKNNEINPHVAANLIKQYFRDLQPSLLDSLSKETVIKIGSGEIDINQSLKLIQEPNQSVFLWLLDLLKEIVQFQDLNRMSIKNLAIVISPNLFNADNITPMQALLFSQKAVALITKFLEWRVNQG